MLKVVAFMRQVANGLQMGGNFGTAHVYRSSLNAIIVYCGKGDFTFDKVTPGWLKGFEIHLRSRGCSWNTVSTYLRTFRAVYNRAYHLLVDKLGMNPLDIIFDPNVLAILLTVLVEDNQSYVLFMDEPEISLHFAW